MRAKCSAPGLQLERRVDLLRQLAVSLEQACDAVRKSDVTTLKAEVAIQQSLCAAITSCSVPRDEKPVWRWANSREVLRARTNSIEDRLEEIEFRVARLNCEYAALLRRGRRTVDIFCRLVESPITYTPPVVTRSPIENRN